MSDLLKDLDFYHLDELIGPEERMTRDAIRHFVQRDVIPYVERHFVNETFPRRYIPEMAKGKLIGCFGLTEPDHGSDPRGMETRARRDGDGWLLNGTKRWITNGSIADVAIVWAKAEEGIAGFIVEKGTPGFTTSDIHGKFSMRASITSELVFEDVRLHKNNHLPEAGGLRAALSCLAQARYDIVWGAIGAARSCYHCALDYVKSRKQFSRPLAGYQLVQRKLVDMLTEVTKGQMVCFADAETGKVMASWRCTLTVKGEPTSWRGLDILRFVGDKVVQKLTYAKAKMPMLTTSAVTAGRASDVVPVDR